MTRQDSSAAAEIIGLAEAEARQASSLVEFRAANLAAPGDVAPAPFHREWSDLLLRGRGHVAVEGFRESGKDQYVFNAFLLYALKYPVYERSYIVLVCSTSSIAERKLKAVTRLYKAHKNLRIGVEKIIEDSGRAFQVCYQDGAQVRIEAYGKGGAIRGIVWGAHRPDIIVINDPQDLEDTYSPSVLEKDWDWFTSEILFLSQSSRIFLIGNNLGANCIIERVFALPADFGFECRKYPILDGDGRSTWEAKFPTETVLSQREGFRFCGRIDTWMREKMCEVMAEESKPLHSEMYDYFNPYSKTATEGAAIKIVLDPAISTKSDADYSVITAFAAKDDGTFNILDVDRDRRNPYKIVDALFAMAARWNATIVGVEVVAYQEMLAQEIERQQVKRGVYFNICRIRANTKISKAQKIRMRLQPKLAVGAIRLPKGAAWIAPLFEETDSFPFGQHDDILDTLAMMDDVKSDILLPNFSQDKCVTPPFAVPSSWCVWSSLAADPAGTMIILFATCSPEGFIYITDELFFKGTPEQLAFRYKAKMGARKAVMLAAPHRMFAANKVNGSRWADAFISAGLNIAETADDYKALAPSLNQCFYVPELSSKPKIQIFPGCRRLLWELLHAVEGDQADIQYKALQALMLLLSCGIRWQDAESVRRRRVVHYY